MTKYLERLKSRAVRNVVCIVAICALTAADAVFKRIAEQSLAGGNDVTLIKNVLSLSYVRNTGAAFSLLSDKTWFLSAFTVVILVLVLAALLTGFFKNTFGDVCGALIFAGGLGNQIDRFARGYVVDYIRTLFVDFPVFNFADVCIVCGVFMLAGYIIYDSVKDKNGRKPHSDAD